MNTNSFLYSYIKEQIEVAPHISVWPEFGGSQLAKPAYQDSESYGEKKKKKKKAITVPWRERMDNQWVPKKKKIKSTFKDLILRNDFLPVNLKILK